MDGETKSEETMGEKMNEKTMGEVIEEKKQREREREIISTTIRK